jgi:phage baseplate assembly protein W
MNPNFGTNLKRFLFEGITNNNIETLKDNILSSILTYIYEITVTNIILVPNTDNNLVSLTIEYYLNISQTPDQITVQFT